jgi:hypothetical protein
MANWKRPADIAANAILIGIVALLVALIARRIVGVDTVLLTLPSFGAGLVTFVGVAGLSGFAMWHLYRAGAYPAKSMNPARLTLALVFGPFALGGVALFALSCGVEMAAFTGRAIAVEPAEFLITGKHIGRKGADRGQHFIEIVSEEGAFPVDVPVMRVIYDEVGEGDSLDRFCLTLQVQRSGQTIRAVLRTPDGTAQPMSVRHCGTGPADLTTPS